MTSNSATDRNAPARNPAGAAGRRAAVIRSLGGLAVLVCVLVGWALAPRTGSAQAEAFEPATVPMEAREVAPGVWYVVGQAGMISTANQGFNSNAAFVVTGAGVVVFDALGTPSLGRRLLELIRGVTDQPIRRIVVSHYHSDHFYGLQALIGPGVDVWAHEAVRDYLATPAPADRLLERRGSLAPWVDARTRIVPPDRYVGAEARFTLGGMTFHLLHAGPAHTPEDLMMLVEPSGVLFVGDLMFTGRIPFVADADVTAWIRAIDRVLRMNPRIVVGGHGPASNNAVDDLSLTRDYLVFLKEKVAAAFEEGLDFEAAYAQIDWSRFSRLPAFEVANRRNAYQTYLNVEREALESVRPAR